MIKYLLEFLVVMSLAISQIQFLLFSLLGIDYDPEESGGLVAILNISFFVINVSWVWWHEFTYRAKCHVTWPYFVIGIIIFLFFFESLFFPNLTLSSFAGKQFMFFGTMEVPAIILATYVYRHDAFDMISRNMDIIMLICSLALILNVPTMMSVYSFQTIGGAGGHQEISYSAAWCFGINFVNLLSKNKKDRFKIFTSKLFKSIFFALLPIQAIICLLGGGRGGGVLLVLSFMVTMYIYGRQQFSKTVWISLVVVAMFVIISLKTGVFADGFGRTFDYLTESGVDLDSNMSDVERTQLRIHSYEIISNSPIIGYGLWNGLLVAGYYMHNIFLDILIAGGVIYLILFLFYMKRVINSILVMLKDPRMCIILPLALFPATMLLFSGFYLTTSLFGFSVTYALLKRKKKFNR